MALPDLISAEELLGAPERRNASISPDGSRLAFVAPWRNRMNVWVQDLDDEAQARCVTADETRSVFNYEWDVDPRWLLYYQDSGGDENYHLFRVDLDDPTALPVDLTPFPGAMGIADRVRPKEPGKLFLQLNNRNPAELDVAELDIATGEITTLAQNPGHVLSWLVTPDRELIARTTHTGREIVLSRWDRATGELHRIIELDGVDYPLGVHPMEISADGTGIWLASYRESDLARLVRIDIRTGEETPVDSHPTLSLDGERRAGYELPSPLIRSRATDELIGVRYLGDRQDIHALDPDFAEVLAKLEALSDGHLGEVSSDLSGQRWVVDFVHDREPATWFYDHTTGEGRRLFRRFPTLDPERLAPMRSVTIPARDGLALPSYLTLPIGVEPEGLPLVLLPHGGPWARDSWHFDTTAQFLANRGYAVLQVNFRGSVGYGKAHTVAAIGEFAGAMHHDLVDGVEWAVAQGYADPQRLAIFGGSYGGYSALVGVTFTPDLFAAAIDYVGISNLATFMETVSPLARRHIANNWFRYVGDPDVPEERADMVARSPISRVDEIRTPLMVVQGANDVRVVQAESDNIVEALRGRGVEVEYMVKDDEGHGFANPENNIDLYRSVERFLARHLGGRAIG
ncbi:S9 family peptidase [Actinoalloteichus hymeniacidonis]|uniref:Dipeptidyl aminopeptidase/acylaminoacyl peptidase n=1 Tax=Actinoalloteichus hymeniacidonis TaxID=340345 RepID=A0AAC9HSJ4_9PSEU|nr:S9 family peptidase [Actinoalloteichus hymeniacidonis]AOS64554.1 dipeptidyl aminopeptidase/acylaminoacyl peptidase [Actinoalloteichus hymeniacidonis]MBB5907374.1 dipeptidyl aminopeptidase/acylaminoacyl peptidase [Actinoalloteichus hymeniacidonis]